MAANINDKISKVSTGAVRPVTTTVQATRSPGAASLTCGDLTGWATDTVVHFQTYRLTGEGKIAPGSQSDFKGIVSGNTINSITLTGGSDNGHQVGDYVVDLPTAAWAHSIADHALVAHNQDGTIKGPLPADTVDTQAIADGSVTPAKRSGGFAVGVLTINTTGAKSVTGLGFQPKQIRFIGTFTSDNAINTSSQGTYDGTTLRSIAHASLGSNHASRYYDDRFSIVSFSGGTLATSCRVDTLSITSDGFTYNVASASPSATIIYEAIA